MEQIKKKIKNKGGRIQANVRRKSVLEQLEKRYNAFKNKGEDKPSWTTHGGTIEKSDHWFEFGFAALVDKVSISTIDSILTICYYVITVLGYYILTISIFFI